MMRRNMSNASLLFLGVRVLHVLLAAAWLGATAFIYLFLEPTLKEMGSASGPVLAALARRRIHVFMSSVGGITVLTGVWLYWRFTGHFDPAVSKTVAARVFGMGGAAGVLALVIGSAVVGRAAKKMSALAVTAMSLPEGAARAATMTQVDVARKRAATAGRIVLVLQIVALALMAIGHYV